MIADVDTKDLEVYDISVVIPTRNSMPSIQEHIAALNEWLPRVNEVIVVDSESSDGTVEYIVENLGNQSVEILRHPPGLYASWNAAISQAKSKYIYIATVNDFMPFDTLEQMYQAAEVHCADVVVSAPIIVGEGGAMMNKWWPIHGYLESVPEQNIHVLRPIDRIAWNLVQLPGTLIGSSASNLYRSSELKCDPFPVDYGRSGDSAWALKHSLRGKWLVLRYGESKFLEHPHISFPADLALVSRSKLYELGVIVVNEFCSRLDEFEKTAIAEELSRLAQLRVQKGRLAEEFNAYKNRMLPWYFFLRAWGLRAQKRNVDGEIKKSRGRLIQSLAQV